MSLTSAGDFRIFATLEKPVRVENELGEKEVQWKPIQNYWIAVKPMSSHELLIAKANRLQTTTRVVVRYFPELKSDMRWVWSESAGCKRILSIDHLIDVEMAHLEWRMDCVETTSG